jgi:hypothetical protein
MIISFSLFNLSLIGDGEEASVQVRDMTGTGEVIKRRVREGVGEFPVDCPLEDCAVRVHYRATIAGTDKVCCLFSLQAALLWPQRDGPSSLCKDFPEAL